MRLDLPASPFALMILCVPLRNDLGLIASIWHQAKDHGGKGATGRAQDHEEDVLLTGGAPAIRTDWPVTAVPVSRVIPSAPQRLGPRCVGRRRFAGGAYDRRQCGQLLQRRRATDYAQLHRQIQRVARHVHDHLIREGCSRVSWGASFRVCCAAYGATGSRRTGYARAG